MMTCDRCGKPTATSIGTSKNSGEWFSCASCGHAFVVPSPAQKAMNEQIVTAAAARFLRSA